jgi:NitT/TauT family transport system ATP-binding protein
MSLTNRILVEGLSFSFGKHRIFQDFNFQSDRPVTMLRGPSGCGKTTLLKLIYGLLAPNLVNKLERSEPPFLVLQSDALVPWFTGRDNIQKFSETVWERVQKSPLFSLIAPFVNQRACDMSYGQRRSIELVRAFCARPGLLLLDEPFNFLDADRRSYFLRYIKGHNGADAVPRIVLTTHYVEDIQIPDADSFEFRGDMPHRALVEISGLTI